MIVASIGHVARSRYVEIGSSSIDRRLPASISFASGNPRVISAGRSKKRPLTHARCCHLANDDSSQFGTVSDNTYRQALAGLSWLSYFPPDVSSGRRDGSHRDAARRRVSRSPRRLGLNEPDRTFTRMRHNKVTLVRTPQGGFVLDNGAVNIRPAPKRTTFDHNGPAAQHASTYCLSNAHPGCRVFLRRPPSNCGSRHRLRRQSDRTRRLRPPTSLSVGITSVSLRRATQATLMARRSTDRPHNGWCPSLTGSKSVPLAAMVSRGLPGEVAHHH